MEARRIFESDKTHIKHIEWEEQDMQKERNLAAQSGTKYIREIENYLKDSKLYLVTNNKESKEIIANQLGNTIQSLYGQKNFRIWSRNFRFVVEINSNGRYRKGEIRPNSIEYFLARLLKIFMR